MTNQQYRAIGFFFAYYQRNLEHITNFQKFKNGRLSFKEYVVDDENEFGKFLGEFRVARNVQKDKRAELLRLTRAWITKKDGRNIDRFATLLNNKEITHGKTMTSLASKILFLNWPDIILPFDTQVKASVKQRTNLYADYFPRIQKERKSAEFKECLDYVEKFALQVEIKFKGITRIKRVRENRLLDILLWSKKGLTDNTNLP